MEKKRNIAHEDARERRGGSRRGAASGRAKTGKSASGGLSAASRKQHGSAASHTSSLERRQGEKAGGRSKNAVGGKSKGASSRSRQEVSRAQGCKLCAVFGLCGGCSMLDLPYRHQLLEKQQYVIDLFAPLVDLTALRRIKGMEDPLHYRNKVVSPYAPGRKLAGGVPPQFARGGGRNKGDGRQGRGGKGAAGARREILTGMYAKGTHKLVPTDSCALENETAKAITLVIRDLMRKWGIEPYDEDAGTGFLRHAVVRVGHSSGEVLVTLVTNDDTFPSAKSFCRELVRRVPVITTVVQNVNTRKTNVILGEEERVLYGPGFILDTLCGLSFRISSTSFYQVNATQTEVLYDTAIELAGLGGHETVIDAYCGTGTIGLVAAKRGAARVIGVDSVEAAIRDARQNAAHNGVENAEFVADDAEAFMRSFAGSCEGPTAREACADDVVLLMDPPRAGSTERFMDAAAKLAPSRIVYISCNPVTQARDVEYLMKRGYRVDAVQPVDMFPHTDHIECICRLVRDGRRAGAGKPGGLDGAGKAAAGAGVGVAAAGADACAGADAVAGADASAKTDAGVLAAEDEEAIS